jgi:hypothetical protein
MDSRGNMYASNEAKAMFEEQAGRELDVRPASQMPKDALPIENGYVASRLALCNRRARQVFYSERRRGKNEVEALAAAEDSYRG